MDRVGVRALRSRLGRRRQRDADHRADHLVGRRRGLIERIGQEVAGLQRQVVPAVAKLGPAAGKEPVAEGDRGGHAQPGRGIEGAGPVVLEAEAAAIGSWRGRAVADDERADSGPGGRERTWTKALPFGAHIHLWQLPVVYAAPMASRSTSSIPGACAASTSVSTPRSASAATISATGSTSAVGLVTWSSMTSRVRGPTAASTASRAISGVAPGNGMRAVTRRAPAIVGHGLQGVAGGGVGMVEQHDLVAGLEPQAARDDVDAGRGVGDEGEVVGIGAEEGAQRRARLVERRLEVAGEEGHRLALHPRPPLVLRREHGARRRAERAVVQEGHGGVERPVDGELGGHRLGIVRPMDHATPPAAIIFDLDGTLVDTVGARIDAWQAAFAERGLDVPRERLEPMIGMDGRRLAAEVLGDDGDAEEVDRRAGELFDERNRDPRPLPGARELLERLDAAGVTWAIATSSRAEQVSASVAALGAGSRAADRRRQRGRARQAGARPAAAGRAPARDPVRRTPGTSATRPGTCARRWRRGCAPSASWPEPPSGRPTLREAGAAEVIGTLDELELPE